VERKKPGRKAELPSKHGIAWPRWTGFRGMTVRDWLQLLIVPFALVVISVLFTAQQDQRQQRIEDERARAERELAVQRAQDEALQAYLDQMSSLLLEKDLRNSDVNSEVRTLAQVRKLTVLERLDPSRGTTVVQFLTGAGLTQSGNQWGDDEPPIIFLDDANLSGAQLMGANLTKANLTKANLSTARLGGAILSDANLNDTVLYETWLNDTDLSGADLSGAIMEYANLNGATGWSEEQLEQATTLKDATMPNGQKYEDWLKSKGSREDGENGGP
jgi:uncharacterized protein YjbI with pentapeptide repeats